MTYPPVIQFETRAHEAEAEAQLERERRAAGAAPRRHRRRRRLVGWLPALHPRPRGSAC